MQQNRNILLVFLATFTLWFGWMYVKQRLWPTPPPTPTASTTPSESGRKEEPREATTPVRLPPAAAVTPDREVLTLGSRDRGSEFQLEVRLDPRGAGVRGVILNRFQAGDAEGRPVWKKGED